MRTRQHQTAPAALIALAAVLGLSGCYTGSAREVSPSRVRSQPGWSLVEGVPFVAQRQQRDCGAAALAMVLAFWQLPMTPNEILGRFPEDKEGLRAGHLRDFVREKGLQAYLITGSLRDLIDEVERGRPVLVGVAKPYRTKSLAHYEVVVGVHRDRRLVLTLDPANGWRENSWEGFAREWVPTKQVTLVVFRPAPVAGAPPPPRLRAAGRPAMCHDRRMRSVAVAVVVGCLWASGCRGGVTFDPDAVATHRMLDGVPPGFLLGAATSAHQIEGGTRNDWTDWEKGRYPDGTPHVADGASAGRIADSWNRWPQDLAALRQLGANVYRVGVEWSRLQPEEGAWDQPSADRYHTMFAAMRAAGVAPMVTLSHFTLPPWVARRGGWDWEGTPAALAAFAGRAAAAFGDVVDLWCTINEPNVLVAKGYLSGQWPPGVKDPRRAALVMRAQLYAHALATAALRQNDRHDADGDGRATKIGIAHNFRIFDPATAHPVDAIVAGGADTFYNESFIDAVATGRIRINIPTVIDINEPYPALRGTFDYLGINYYTRERVVGRLRGPTVYSRSEDKRPGRAYSDMGWEIYPEGLYRLLKRYAGHGWPLLVTEAGIADRRGDVRPDFLRAHIYATDRARAEGVNVIGFIFWSLIDNFEWSHGFRGRFGLFTIDFDDPALARRPTAAVSTFQEAARALRP